MNSALTSANRGAEWLLDRVQTDGSVREAKHLGAYYKLPFALAATGHLVECERVLDYVSKRFLTPEGDLDGEGLSWYEQFRIYPHAWLAFTSAMRGRWEIARPLMGFLDQVHNRATGGFRARADGSEEIMTTCMAGIASLWCGRLDLATATAGWLETVWRAQPDLKRGLYHVWQPGKGLVTEFTEDRAVWCLVDTKKLRQWYFLYGISAAFLSQLSAHTGDPRPLALGREYLHASRFCREDVFRTPQAGKVGWGAAWSFRVGRDAADESIAKAVVDGLIALQQEDGSWADPAYDLPTTIDVSAEMTGLQAAIGLVLS